MALTTRLTKVGHGSEHFNERTGMCYHQTPPWERVVGHVRDAGQAKPHLEHNPLSLLGACYATSRRQLNDPEPRQVMLEMTKLASILKEIAKEVRVGGHDGSMCYNGKLHEAFALSS